MSGAGCSLLGWSTHIQLNLLAVHRQSVQPTQTSDDPQTKPAVLSFACVINGLSARRDKNHVTESNDSHKNNHNEVYFVYKQAEDRLVSRLKDFYPSSGTSPSLSCSNQFTSSLTPLMSHVKKDFACSFCTYISFVAI